MFGTLGGVGLEELSLNLVACRGWGVRWTPPEGTSLNFTVLL